MLQNSNDLVGIGSVNDLVFAYKKIQRNGDAFSVGPTNLEMKNRNPLPLHGDVKRKLIFLSTDKIKKNYFLSI